MKNPNLYSIKRDFELVLEAFQGLEELASSGGGDSSAVGQAMVPLIFQAEEVLSGLEIVYDATKRSTCKPAFSSSNVVRLFPHGKGG